MRTAFLLFAILFLSFIQLNAQWYEQNSGTTDLLYAIKFVDNNNGWVTNLNGTKLFHTTNGGINWYVQKDFGTSTIWNFAFINDSIGYIYSHGAPAHLLKSTDGGTTWQIIYIFGSTVDDIKWYDENIGWGISNELSGSLFKTTNGGLNWQGIDFSNSYGGILGKIGIIDESSVIVTGNDLGGYIVFKTTDGGASWTEIPVNYALLGGRIQFVTPNIGWIDDFGNLYKTTDGGYNWEFQVSTHYDFYFINENVGWYVYNDQINKTTDGGQTWIPQNSGTNNTLYTIYFIDQNNGWISGDSGTILYTPNGGILVEFILFNAEISGSDIVLNWQTATETNNQGFEIQRADVSSQSSGWEDIGFVEGKGTTTEPQSYTYTDENLSVGKYSYRLKQVDFDGSYKYSDIVEVDVAPISVSFFQNYPNPFNPKTNIKYQIPNTEFVTLKIYDILGNEVAILVNEYRNAGSYDLEFNADKLSSGVYYCQLKAGGFVETKKMIYLK